MGMVDILIIIFILFGFFIGWKRGFTKQIISAVGLILAVVIAYLFKNPISQLFYKFFPFINFKGEFAGVSSLNIIFYELMAFIILFCLLMAIVQALTNLSEKIEKFLKFTIILGIPSKILGGIAGIITNFVYAFVALFFLSLPVFNLEIVTESKLVNKILSSTPVLSNVCNKTLTIFNEIVDLKKEYKDKKNNQELNSKIIDLLVEHEYISEENIKWLIDSGKLIVTTE